MLFRSDNMVPEGIESEDLCKIRSKVGDKKTLGVDAEKKLNEVYGKSTGSGLTIRS